MKTSAIYVLIWLAAAVVAAFLAMQFDTAAFVDGHYIPVGNDSFYHARRILDTAIGARGFYEFDTMIHVPEGSWLVWPWAFDWLIAQALSAALWIRQDTDPMAFLAHVPVAWVFVNIGLVTMICRRLDLGPALSALAVFGMACLPLTQLLHGVGVIDHHFMEWTFVLATLWAGLRYLTHARVKDAVLIAAVLGAAPAFHNGLFILQIPLLAGVFVLWIRGMTPDARSLYWLAGALFLATLLVVLPSAAFRDMQSEFWTLSWFHLYVAACSGTVFAYFGRRPMSRQNVAGLAVVVTVLAIPLVAKLASAAEFMTAKLVLLEHVTEVKSPVTRLFESGGVRWAGAYFSGLFFVIPLLLIVFACRAFRSSEPRHIYFSIFALFGLLMLLLQFRFHLYGSWVMLIGGVVLLEWLRARRGISVLAASAVGLLVFAVAFRSPSKNLLFYIHPPALSDDYAVTRSLFPGLAAACAEHGGTALAYNDDGHYIRFHTDCSVIANNFLLTPIHGDKIREADRYLQMSPEQLLRDAPHVSYVFVRMYDLYSQGPNGGQPRPVADVAASNAPLFAALTFRRDLPGSYELIDELRIPDDRNFAYASVYRIVRDP